MKLIITGPQASGKGTQAEKIAKKYSLKHLSTGEALRAEIAKGTTLGKEAAQIINKGELVPAAMLQEILEQNIKNNPNIIFDGYPRTLEQAEILSRLTDIDAVITINVSEEETVKRISSRYICSKCGKGYNTIFLPPKNEGLCDIEGERLIQRDDDRPAAIKKRLAAYHEQTAPVIDYYRGKGVNIIEINGEQSIEEVFKDIIKAL